jgi:excisionase family DNA binding protein
MTELCFAYTVAQVAEGFGRSELTIRRWIKAGQLRAVRIGVPGTSRPTRYTPFCIRRNGSPIPNYRCHRLAPVCC